MKPLCLQGHERAITRVRCNRDGDLLFSVAKDKHACLWFTENGERVGTYNGHNGAIFDVDVTYDSATCVTGSADASCALWDVATGKQLFRMAAETPVSAVSLSYSGNLFFYTATARMRRPGLLAIFDMRDSDQMADNRPGIAIPTDTSVSAACWSYLDQRIVTGHENGTLNQFDLKMRKDEPVNFSQEHRHQIQDIQMNADQSLMITSSKDKTARLWDAQKMEPHKLYKAERPVNSAAIAPDQEHVILGGGEEAMKVTQRTQTGGQFETKFYHLIFEDEYARVKGHFGPINSLCYLPNGETFVTGGEDGYLRICNMDAELADFKMDY